MLLVPMLVGEQVVGVIVLSSLGYGKFDEEDQRLLEVLAAHAAVAFENAKLLGAEREAAATSAALLELSQTLTGRQTIGDILQDAVESVPSLVPAAVVAAYVRDVETGGFRVARVHEIERGTLRPRSMVADVPREVAESFLKGQSHPFIIPKVLVEQIPEELWLLDEARDVLIAPLDWDPDGFGALVIVAESGTRRLRRSRSAVRAWPVRHRLPRPGQRTTTVRTRTLPRAGGEPRCRVLGGRPRHDGVHVPGWSAGRHPGRRGRGVAEPECDLGLTHRRRRS